MSRFALATILVTACAFADVRGIPARGQDSQFHAGTNTVSIYATVIDPDGRLVPNLTKDDFEVFDDGHRQTLTQFANTAQPITVVVMLDRSVSMEARFNLERAGAADFVADLMPGDRARIGSFNGLIRIDPVGFSGDHDELIRILYLDLPDAGLTPLWNATTAAMNALAREPGRRVVLLFSDGEDNPGLPGRKTDTYVDVLNHAKLDDIMIYAVGMDDGCVGEPDPLETPDGSSPALAQRGMPPKPGGGPDNGGTPPPSSPIPGRGPIGAPVGPGGQPIGAPAGVGVSIPIGRLRGNGLGERPCSVNRPNPALRALAADGGGGYVELQGTDDLSATFARLADELHHQYLLGFTIATLDGRTHALDVRTRDGKLHVRARTSYVAAAR